MGNCLVSIDYIGIGVVFLSQLQAYKERRSLSARTFQPYLAEMQFNHVLHQIKSDATAEHSTFVAISYLKERIENFALVFRRYTFPEVFYGKNNAVFLHIGF